MQQRIVGTHTQEQMQQFDWPEYFAHLYGESLDAASVQDQLNQMTIVYSPGKVTFNIAATLHSAYPDNSLVEVFHLMNFDPDYYNSRWLWHAKGSGVWFDIGRTLVVNTHEELNQKYGVAGCPYTTLGINASVQSRYANIQQGCPFTAIEAIQKARAEGYNSIQILRHSLDMTVPVPKMEFIDLQPYVKALQPGTHLNRYSYGAYNNKQSLKPCVVTPTPVVVEYQCLSPTVNPYSATQLECNPAAKVALPQQHSFACGGGAQVGGGAGGGGAPPPPAPPRAPAPPPGCSWDCYINNYRDVKGKVAIHGADAHLVASNHWAKYGQKEGRNCKCSRADI